MKRSESLNAPFQAAQSELQNYVIALESENLKLHKQIGRLQAQDVTKQHRIVALEDELKQLTKKHGISLHIDLGNAKKPDAP